MKPASWPWSQPEIDTPASRRRRRGGGPARRFRSRLASALAADPVMVAVQAKRIWRQHPDGTLDVVGAVPGPTRAVVVSDAVMQACVRVGRIAVARRRLGGGRSRGARLSSGRVGRWYCGGGRVGGGRRGGRRWEGSRWHGGGRRQGSRAGRRGRGGGRRGLGGGAGQRGDHAHEYQQAHQGSHDEPPSPVPRPGPTRRPGWWWCPPRLGWWSAVLRWWRLVVWRLSPALVRRLRSHDLPPLGGRHPGEASCG